MIVIDIPMPEKCLVCPCSNWIRTGEFEGMLMCYAMEFRDAEGQRIRERYLVDEFAKKRPGNCPIRLEVVK